MDTKISHLPPERNQRALEQLEAIHDEIAALRESFEAFAHAFLAARFPFGQPDDRFAIEHRRRRRG